MKKSILTSLCLLLVTMTLMAVPAKRGLWKTITLEDGSEQLVELRGDEFASWWATEDGRCFVVVEGTEVYREVTQAELTEKVSARRMEEAQKAQEAKGVTESIVPLNERKKIPGATNKTLTGERKGIIILVNFADTKFESAHDKDYYERFANEEGFTDSSGNTHSVRDYYLEQSNGKLDLSFDVAGPVELANEHTYYSHDQEKHYSEMIMEACQGAYDQGTDFSKYDWDGDGTVEQVFVVYAGHGAADTGDTSYTWPHKSTISATYGGTRVTTYACGCELAANNRGDGIGTICHEYSHCFDLPDAYDTVGSNYGMGTWSILDYGCYNGSGYGYLPCGFTSYERAFCGWLDPIELTEEAEVTGMKGLTDGGEAYIVYNKGNTNEFYLMENRSDSGFDASLSGSGLMVLHLDYSSNVWFYNLVNTIQTGFISNDHERYTIVPADNVRNRSSEGKDPWPSSGKTRLDNSTTPADEAYNFNTDGTKFMNLSLSNIKKADDGTISFNFYPSGETPRTNAGPEGNIFYESFDMCDGAGGNDGDFSVDVATGEFYPDNDGWSCSTSHGASACAMFGSNTQAANVVTPTFNITEETILTFRAAPVTARVSGVVALSCETSGISLSETEIELPQGEWTYFTIHLTGSGDVAIRMKETSGLNRFFLDSVTVMPLSEVPEGIVSVETTPIRTQEGIYTLQGVKVEKPTQKGVYIVNGKKYINK